MAGYGDLANALFGNQQTGYSLQQQMLAQQQNAQSEQMAHMLNLPGQCTMGLCPDPALAQNNLSSLAHRSPRCSYCGVRDTTHASHCLSCGAPL